MMRRKHNLMRSSCLSSLLYQDHGTDGQARSVMRPRDKPVASAVVCWSSLVLHSEHWPAAGGVRSTHAQRGAPVQGRWTTSPFTSVRRRLSIVDRWIARLVGCGSCSASSNCAIHSPAAWHRSALQTQCTQPTAANPRTSLLLHSSLTHSLTEHAHRWN